MPVCVGAHLGSCCIEVLYSLPFYPVIVISSCVFKHLKKAAAWYFMRWIDLVKTVLCNKDVQIIYRFIFFLTVLKNGHGERFFPLASEGLESYKAKHTVSWWAPVRALAFLFCSLLVSSSMECLVSAFHSRLEKGLLLPAFLRLVMEKNLRTKVLG